MSKYRLSTAALALAAAPALAQLATPLPSPNATVAQTIGITKAEVRTLARDVFHLPMHDKPSMACLASRFPYGAPITPDRLAQVEHLEAVLRQSGFAVNRARHYGETVRIEVEPEKIHRILSPDVSAGVVAAARALGFAYVTLDLQGFRSGSINETLPSTTAGQIEHGASI